MICVFDFVDLEESPVAEKKGKKRKMKEPGEKKKKAKKKKKGKAGAAEVGFILMY